MLTIRVPKSLLEGVDQISRGLEMPRHAAILSFLVIGMWEYHHRAALRAERWTALRNGAEYEIRFRCKSLDHLSQLLTQFESL